MFFISTAAAPLGFIWSKRRACNKFLHKRSLPGLYNQLLSYIAQRETDSSSTFFSLCVSNCPNRQMDRGFPGRKIVGSFIKGVERHGATLNIQTVSHFETPKNLYFLLPQNSSAGHAKVATNSPRKLLLAPLESGLVYEPTHNVFLSRIEFY